MKKELDILVSKAQELLKEHPERPLDASLRNSIFNALDTDKKRSYLIIKTFHQLYGSWKDTWPQDSAFLELLHAYYKYANSIVSKTELDQLISHRHKYMEDRMLEGKWKAFTLGMGLIHAGYEISNHDFLVLDFTEPSADPETWSSLYMACLALSAIDIESQTIDPTKNVAFWNAFLNNVEPCWELLDIPLEPLPSLPSAALQIRFQELAAKTNGEIKAQLEKLQSIFTLLLKEKGWEELLLEAYQVDEKHAMVGFYKQHGTPDYHKIDNTQLFLFNNKHQTKTLLKEVKKAMYQLDPKEGAWYKARIKVPSKGDLAISFDYDSWDPFFEKWTDKLDFYKDFDKFPRNAEHTPFWLQDIRLHHVPL